MARQVRLLTADGVLDNVISELAGKRVSGRRVRTAVSTATSA
jgi:hypothetical protein